MAENLLESELSSRKGALPGATRSQKVTVSKPPTAHLLLTSRDMPSRLQVDWLSACCRRTKYARWGGGRNGAINVSDHFPTHRDLMMMVVANFGRLCITRLNVVHIRGCTAWESAA